MRLLARYIAEIFLSSVNPLFFRSAVRRSAVSAFGYYVFFTFLHGLAISVAGALWISHNLGPGIGRLEARLPNFAVSLAGGELSTTLPQPISFGDRDFMLVVDTTNRAEGLNAYKSAILISKTSAILKRNAFETREYSYAPVPDFSLTMREALDWLGRHDDQIAWSLFSLFALLIFPLIWTFLFPVILILGVPFFIFAAIIRSTLRFAQILTILFYAVTLPTLVQTFFMCRGTTLQGRYSWLYFAWTVVAILACYRVNQSDSGNGSVSGGISGSGAAGATPLT